MAVPLSEQRILLQKSGNRCAFPDCRRVLTAKATLSDRTVVLGEIAHIVAESPGGPRGNSPLSSAERNRYPNLILLCTQHHQLVDGQPHTYSVERLLGMREEHEKWIERTLGRGANGDRPGEFPPVVAETVHSSLLPVERMPRHIYSVPCSFRSESEVRARMRALRQGEMAPFILRGGMLFTFQNLNYAGGPFADLVPGRSAERYDSREWWDDGDRAAWFLSLVNRALNKLTGRCGLMLDRVHRRYYFQPENAGNEYQIRYRPLNQRFATRKVVWQPRRKSTGEGRGYWYHCAVSLRFLRTGAEDWSLAIL